ncbi:MAG: hypothetical protein PHP44_11530 [Kiritimatiellae bacterium]|nr:hypothetical protein [Kiritimatiellia bacterium]
MDENTEQPKNPANTVPPTIRLTPAAGKDSPSAPPKIRLQPATSSFAKPADPSDAAREKRETSRVNLPPISDRRPDTVTVPPIKLSATEPAGATQAQGNAEEIKSIRIKRPGTAALRPPTVESKKATARVDIQEALASSGTPSQQPKTIRLKRPGTTIIEKAQQPTPETTTAFRIEEAKKSETSRIELPAEASVEMPRRRKTVQIKRSTGGPATRVMNTGKTSSAPAPLEETFITFKAEEESSVVFSVVGLAATIVTCILLYVLAAQTILPSLPWPGKL